MQSGSVQNRTRAIRPRGRRLRTSHNSRPRERTSGMPIGQENSTSLMSSPIAFRSSSSKALQPLAHRLPSAIEAVEACR